ncbi:TetR/AcrR family transcriptional regulator [Rubricoccus marinus]|uniref:HTH tetR-type domain-containing protein n=1 Tax=Rubricoccus marinus TaxID=716817 RepID=A0A259TTU7_9BACT|nr:TetR/AcrR family transcriptional regulator [Rubricoccus marinus]OZC01149.1 hypothetical protein BSZ36_18695 [Rubricoccus marinus]
MTADRSTPDRLLDLAAEHVERGGIHAFSFRDLAGPLGLTHAAVHYHFRSKADLAQALASQYRRRLLGELAALDDRESDPATRLRAFVAAYGEGVRAGRFCLCGMLASDASSLPEGVRAEVEAFFESVEGWLADTLCLGRRAGALAFDGEPADVAALALAAVEGAMLTAWSAPDADHADLRYRRATDALLSSLTPCPSLP